MDEVIKKVKSGAAKVKDNAEKLTRVALSKTKTVIEEKKYSFTISGIENKVNEILIKLGNVIYDEYENGTEFSEDINEKCRQIQELKKDISELRKKIAEIKNSDVCENCGKAINENDTFCAKCGKKVN